MKSRLRNPALIVVVSLLNSLSLQGQEPFSDRAWLEAGQGGRPAAVAISPDGQWIVSANEDATVKLWEAADGRLVRSLTGCPFQSTALAFRGNDLLAVGYYDGSIRLWSMTNTQPIRTLNVVWLNTSINVTYTNLSGRVNALAFNADGTRLISGGGDWFTRVWNTSTGQHISGTVRHRGSVLAAARSPDGSRMACAGEDGAIVILRTSDWAPVKTNYHSTNAIALAYAPDGTRLASAALDGTLRIWRTSDWGLDRTLTNGGGSVLCMAYSADSQTLFSGDEAGLATVREASASWAVTRSWTAHNGAARCLALAPDDGCLVTGGDDHQVRTWRVSDGAMQRELTRHGGRIGRVAHCPDGARVASAADDGTVRLWDAESGALAHTLQGHTNQVSAMAFAPDATLLVSGGGCLDNNLMVWRCSDGALLRAIPVHSNGVNALALSPDCATAASAGDRTEPAIRIWNLGDGTLAREFAGDTNGTAVLAYSPDGSLLAAAGQFNEGRVRLWNVSGGTSTQLGMQSGGVQALAFNPTGAQVACAGRTNNLVEVWRTSDGATLATLNQMPLGARAVTFSPDGSLLAAAGSDRIQFWRVSDWQPVWTYTNEMFRISSFSFSPNGTFFVLGREDGTVGRLWNPHGVPLMLALGIESGSTGEQRLQIQNPNRSPFMSVQSSPDLVSWGTLTNLVVSTNLVRFTDWAAQGVPIRFYRLSAPE